MRGWGEKSRSGPLYHLSHGQRGPDGLGSLRVVDSKSRTKTASARRRRPPSRRTSLKGKDLSQGIAVSFRTRPVEKAARNA